MYSMASQSKGVEVDDVEEGLALCSNLDRKEVRVASIERVC